MTFTANNARLEDALDRARLHAPFLALIATQEPEIIALLHQSLLAPDQAARFDDAGAPIARRLRRERRRVALVTAIGDLSGMYDLTRVTHLLTNFADSAFDRAIRAAIDERTPGAEPQGFAGIALGKQGSRELNYSSDIDPILIYDPDKLPCRPREDPADAAVRIARRVIELLQARDGDGYVLRVDLRLRPSPEVTPVALPVEAAISYYESQALPWERAAFIRARAAAGDRALGSRFLDAIRPFVWRRALDYGAIGEIHAISARIREHHFQGQALGPGFDLKRGRGGIREVEFFAQIHQLIHGGRDATLRVPATRDALAALANAGWIGGAEATALTDAYTLFRTIEHRLQMVDDRQTHALPKEPAALDNVARLHGLDDGAALITELRPHIDRVGEIYDAIDRRRGGGLPANGGALADELAARHIGTGVVRLIEAWRAGSYPALRSAVAREALEAVLPRLVDAFAQAPDPDQAFARLDSMLSRLPSAINFFRLLEAQPALARLTSAILCHAPTLADALSRRADLLDGLIDASALAPMPDVVTLAAEMRAGERGADYEQLLDRVRRLVGEKRFALGAQLIASVSDPLEVAAGYARVAEAAVEVLAGATVAEFERRHGRVPGSELAILAFGRMGGAALTHASDLDLIFLFTGDYQSESQGEKPLGAVTYYNRLAQRVIGALSARTAAGPLYEIDVRLRPSGAQGPLVVSLEGFRRYQEHEAWTWEHMALTRARPIFGSERARSALCNSVAAVLGGTRPKRDIAREAAAMRAEMAAHKPPAGPLDAKLLPGGLVDLEFAVHTQQLVHRTGFAPQLPHAIRLLVEQGLLPASLAKAHDFLTRLLVTVRLVAPDAQPPALPTRALIARAVGAADWEATLAEFERVRQEVATCWAHVREGG